MDLRKKETKTIFYYLSTLHYPLQRLLPLPFLALLLLSLCWSPTIPCYWTLLWPCAGSYGSKKKLSTTQELCKELVSNACVTCHIFPPWMPMTWGYPLLHDSGQRARCSRKKQGKLNHLHNSQLHEQGREGPTKKKSVFKHRLLRGKAEISMGNAHSLQK